MVVGVLAVAGGAGLAVAASSGERLPGEAATGDVPQGIAGTLAQARQLYGGGETLEAIKLYDEVLAQDPRQPEALTYRGWLLSLAGDAAGSAELLARGEESIDAALAADPAYPDARVFKGLVLYRMKGDAAGAVPYLQAFLADDPPPEMVPLVEGALRRALEESAPPVPPPTTAVPGS